jgi:CBS domain-containing membrane protein
MMSTHATATPLVSAPVTRVRELMTDVVETLVLGDSLDLARRLMDAGRLRHLPVVDGDERLVGLVTHRRILEAWVSHGRPGVERPGEVAAEVPVEMLMERNVLTVSPDTTAALAAALLESSRFGCLPVLEHDKLVGIITEADFLRFARQYFELEPEWRRSLPPPPAT